MGMFTLNELNKTSKNEKIDISSENFFQNGLIDKILSRNTVKKEIANLLELLISKSKIPKKTDLELPNINFENNSKNTKIDKSRPSGNEYIKNIFDDFVYLGKNDDENLSYLGLGKIGSQTIISIVQNYPRLNKSIIGN